MTQKNIWVGNGYYYYEDQKDNVLAENLLNEKTIADNCRFIKLTYNKGRDRENWFVNVLRVRNCAQLDVSLLLEHIEMRKEFNKRISSIELLYIESFLDRFIGIPDVYRMILNYL